VLVNPERDALPQIGRDDHTRLPERVSHTALAIPAGCGPRRGMKFRCAQIPAARSQ